MAGRSTYSTCTDYTVWKPASTHLPKEWVALAKKLGQQVKRSSHTYVLKMRYDAQRVSDLLRSWGLPWEVVMAGYLWEYDQEQIRSANLDGVHKVIGHMNEANVYARYIEDENLPPLLSPPYRDVGALFLAIAIYYQALRTLQQYSNEQPYTGEMLVQIESVGHTLRDIGIRLSLWFIKREVEDLVEQLRNPRKFQEDKKEHARILKQDKYMIEATCQLLMTSYQEVAQQPITVFYTPCGVAGMKRRLHDARATSPSQETHLTGFDIGTFEVLVPYVKDCYVAFEALSQLGYIQDRVTDLIANPKPNGCSHLALGLILKPKGLRMQTHSWQETQNRICQLQIATYMMYALGWYGCLHPDYYHLCMENELQKTFEPLSGQLFLHTKEGRVLITVKEGLMNGGIHPETETPIIVYDIHRKPFALPNGATALDFAYAVGRTIGDHASEAFLNNRKAPLYRVLGSGDIIEIKTTREVQAQDYWLLKGYAITQQARNFIKEALDRRRLDRRGYHLLLQELERYHYMLTPEELDEPLDLLVKQHELGTPKAYLERLDKSEEPPFTPAWAAQGIIQQMAEQHEPSLMDKSRSSWTPVLDMPQAAFKKLFRKQRVCEFCQPSHPRDMKITGLLRDRSGELIVHKESCPHLIDHSIGQRSMLLPMVWQLHHPTYRVTFFLRARDRKGLVRDIAKQLDRHLCNFIAIQAEATAEHDAWIRITVETYTDTEAVDIWQELGEIENVTKVEIDATTTPVSIRNHLQGLREQQNGTPHAETPLELAWEESDTVPLPRLQTLKNPFDISRPATAKMFFGRSKETKMMRIELCEGKHGKALILYGPLRSGKSSICKNFIEHQVSSPFWGVLFSLQNMRRQSEEVIFAQLADKICVEFTQQLQRSAPNWLAYSDIDPKIRFRHLLQDCITQIPQTRLILALDEFGGTLEAYEQGMLDHSFFTYWKDLMDEIPQLSLILALPTRAHTLLTNVFSHAFSFAASLPVEFLDTESAARLLVNPLQDQHIMIRPHTVTLATRLTEGNPYYLTLIGWTLINQLNREKDKQIVTDEDLLLVMDQLIEDGSYQNFDFLRYELQCREEFQILQAIVELTGRRTSKVQLKKIADWLNLPVHIVRQHVDRLRIGLILEEHGSTSRPFYSFKIELVRRWLTRNYWFFTSAKL